MSSDVESTKAIVNNVISVISVICDSCGQSLSYKLIDGTLFVEPCGCICGNCEYAGLEPCDWSDLD